MRALLALLLLCSLAGCRGPVPTMTAAEAISKHAPELMAMPGVVGVAETADERGRPVLVIMLRERSPQLERRLPKRLEGYPVKLEVTGAIRPLGD